MKKNKFYFIIVFLIIAISLGYNVLHKSETSKAMSIDMQQEYRNQVVKEVNKILGKNIPVRIADEEDSDIIVKHESQITDEQRKQYRIIELINDPIVLVDKSKSTVDSVNLKDKNNRVVAGNKDTVDFVNSKLKDINKIYIGDKNPYKLVTNENIFYGLAHLYDFTNDQRAYLKVIKINNLNYDDNNYVLNDKICILIKKETSFDSINQNSLSDFINKKKE